MKRSALLLGGTFLIAACGGNPGGSSAGGRNAGGSTGGLATGGTPATGGAATGGTTATGGAATGGTSPSTGGALGTGGRGSGAGGGVGGGGGGPTTTGGAPATGGSAGGAGGGAPGACTRASLQTTVAMYLEALTAHDPAAAPLAERVRYTENTKEVKIGEGLWKTAGAVKLERDLIDVPQCATFSQVVLPDSGEDVVFTQRLEVVAGKITEAEAVITRKGDWNFDAAGYLATKARTWDVLPESQRTPRDTLITMPKVYWDYFKDNKTTKPPFGNGCTRVEGGKGNPIPCTTGIPSGVTISDRRFWADEEAGVSAGVALFGGTSGLLDVHYFKLIGGTIREVYAMTTNTSYATTGWPGGVP